jgi:uncharacterized membrane protein
MLYYRSLCEALNDQSTIVPVPMAALMLLLWQQPWSHIIYYNNIILWIVYHAYIGIATLVRPGGALAIIGFLP